MPITLPTIDTVGEDLVDWLQDGEKADMVVLNRPSKDLATVINTIIGLINDGSIGGSGQMLGANTTDIKTISYNAQTIAEDIVIPSNLNAYAVGDITIQDGFTVTISDNSIWKIL